MTYFSIKKGCIEEQPHNGFTTAFETSEIKICSFKSGG